MNATRTITLYEWQELEPSRENGLEGVFLDAPPVRQLAEQLDATGRLGIKEMRNGLAVRARSYVGRIRLGELEITVLPKIRQSSLLRLLRYAFGFRNLHILDDAAQQLETAGFEDLLVSQLNAEVAELLSRGLRRTYEPRREYLGSPRGRIDLQRIAADGGVVTAAIPCAHHPRLEDSLLNRVLHAGMGLAASLANDMSLRRRARRLAAAFEELVSPIRLDATAIDRVSASMNRMTRTYEPAVSLIRLIYEASGIAFAGSPATLRLPGFLFDMNRFFQALLSRFLRENLPGFKVREEHGLRRMLRFAAGFNPQNRLAPTPRPDFAVLKDGVVESILDAKYRDLWEKPLPRNMLYQLAMYAASHQKRVAAILYPTVDPSASEARIDVREPLLGREIGQVQLRPVPMQLVEELACGTATAQNQRARSRLALWMAFG
ncbi:MAG: hypothetical protein RIC55_26595 [Pirellulaceae bacterium]